jgi:hypothetical protein
VDHGNRIAYTALQPGVDVLSSDGSPVGKVEHVLADEDKDIFDGLVIDVQSGPGGLRFADAEQVAEIYERAVVLTVPQAEVDALPTPGPAPAVMETDPADAAEGPLERKLRRAWDLISGNY